MLLRPAAKRRGIENRGSSIGALFLDSRSSILHPRLHSQPAPILTSRTACPLHVTTLWHRIRLLKELAPSPAARNLGRVSLAHGAQRRVLDAGEKTILRCA